LPMGEPPGLVPGGAGGKGAVFTAVIPRKQEKNLYLSLDSTAVQSMFLKKASM